MIPETENNYSNKIILTDKPLNITSADVVYRIKRNFDLKKAGHAGTLDPKATGLLILCTDKMTKRISEFMTMEKEYTGIIRIGAVTKTYDTESEEENHMDVSHINDEDINNAIKEFSGEIEQTPPAHSAVKINGKPVYKLARKGEEVKLEPRKVLIKSIEINRISEKDLLFRIVCSKGTYIRALANDIGRKLKVGGYLKELRRERIGEFNTEGLTEEIKGIKFRVLQENV